MFYYMDWTYVVLVLPAILLAMISNIRVNSVFQKYSKVRNSRGLTGAQAAQMVLRENGLSDVRVEHIPGTLNDHYDPRTRVISLSDAVYGSDSCAAVGVACHEAGHAIQHAENYAPLAFRNAIIPVTNIGSRLAVPLIIVGLILAGASNLIGTYIAYAGIACFGLTTLFQLITLPTEFNASSRAMTALKEGNILDKEELGASRKVLSAAAMTYVAALAVSLAQLLRFVILINNSSRRR